MYNLFGIGKFYPGTGREVPYGDYRYGFTPSLTSTLDGGGSSTPRPGRFTPRREIQFPLFMSAL